MDLADIARRTRFQNAKHTVTQEIKGVQSMERMEDRPIPYMSRNGQRNTNNMRTVGRREQARRVPGASDWARAIIEAPLYRRAYSISTHLIAHKDLVRAINNFTERHGHRVRLESVLSDENWSMGTLCVINTIRLEVEGETLDDNWWEPMCAEVLFFVFIVAALDKREVGAIENITVAEKFAKMIARVQHIISKTEVGEMSTSLFRAQLVSKAWYPHQPPKLAYEMISGWDWTEVQEACREPDAHQARYETLKGIINLAMDMAGATYMAYMAGGGECLLVEEHICGSLGEESIGPIDRAEHEELGRGEVPLLLCFVCGGPCSGKTTLSENLQRVFPGLIHVERTEIARLLKTGEIWTPTLGVEQGDSQNVPKRFAAKESGQLSERVTRCMIKALSEFKEASGFIIDGAHPKNIAKFEQGLGTHMACVLTIRCPRTTMIQRICEIKEKADDVQSATTYVKNSEVRVNAYLRKTRLDRQLLHSYEVREPRMMYELDATLTPNGLVESAQAAIRSAIGCTPMGTAILGQITKTRGQDPINWRHELQRMGSL